MTENLTFLKLGGSLITDKDNRHTHRPDVLARLAAEIATALKAQPDLPLLLGHGSGSFGHTAARNHGTRQGVSTRDQWLGFAEVWKEARALNQIVVDALWDAGVPVIALPPSAAATASNGQVLRWDLTPIRAALNAGLVPMVNGDVIFDVQRGGTILSTEDLFIRLAKALSPGRILLAGRDDGVYADFPACTTLIRAITPTNFMEVADRISGSASVDVTGGMIEKVRAMLDLVESLPQFEARIFSGLKAGAVQSALLGGTEGTDAPGTVIRLSEGDDIL